MKITKTMYGERVTHTTELKRSQTESEISLQWQSQVNEQNSN